MKTFQTAQVNGHIVTWAQNGGIYFSRDFHDGLVDTLQGIHYRAKTINEFGSICRLLKNGSKLPAEGESI